MAPTASKMGRIESSAGKLWTSEERMFGEKMFYLNKSTTKHVIVGLSPPSFDAVVKLCDRVTGTNITIKKLDFPQFVRVVVSIQSGIYNLEKLFITGASDLCGITFRNICAGIWELTPIDLEYSSILIHETTLKTLLRIERLIIAQLMNDDLDVYRPYIEELRENTIEMDANQIIEYLYSQTSKYTTRCMEYQIISDLICNMESYSKLNEFGSGFFFRSSYKK